MQEEITYNLLYPEMYYRIQPFILSACDHIDQCGYGVPMKDAVKQMSDKVYADVCKMYPEFSEYEPDCTKKTSQEGEQVESQRYGGFRNYGGRGLLRDVLDIWLLNELFNRRRRY